MPVDSPEQQGVSEGHLLSGPHCVSDAAVVRLRDTAKSANADRRLGMLDRLVDVVAGKKRPEPCGNRQCGLYQMTGLSDVLRMGLQIGVLVCVDMLDYVDSP